MNRDLKYAAECMRGYGLSIVTDVDEFINREFDNDDLVRWMEYNILMLSEHLAKFEKKMEQLEAADLEKLINADIAIDQVYSGDID
mgnify:CR=1 FL=1